MISIQSKHESGTDHPETAVVEPWLNAHSLIMLLATIVAAVSLSSAPIVLACGGSFAAFFYLNRRSLRKVRPWGGYANQMTALRLVLVLCVAALMARIPQLWIALLFGINVLLDIADGKIARRYRPTQFGGAFDREVDAVFVLVAYMYFFLIVEVGVWALLPALLPYGYRLVVWRRGGKMPGHVDRQPLAVALAGINFALLVIAVAMPPRPQVYILIVSICLVTCSFLVSFWKLLPR